MLLENLWCLDCFGQEAGAHQQGRPDDGVVAEDVLGDQMVGVGPESAAPLAARDGLGSAYSF